jgi:hypothetical protein
MSKDKQPNPIYDRLTRNMRSPSILLVMAISVGCGLAVLMAVHIAFGNIGNLMNYILLPTGFIVATSPAAMAVYTANLAAKDQREENFQMMKLAGIKEETMIAGYADAAFRRLRLLAVITTTLFPTLIMGLATVILFDDTASGFIPPGSGFILMGGFLPIVIALTFGLWFVQKFGCKVAAYLTVRVKRPTLVMIASSLFMMIITSVTCYITAQIAAFIGLMTVLMLAGGW